MANVRDTQGDLEHEGKYMSEYKKTQLTLPESVVTAMNAGDQGSRNLYISALRKRGWTLQSISDATGVTRERVRQIAEKVSESSSLPEVPEPPLKPVKVRRVYREPDTVKLARLLELQPIAQQNRHHGGDKAVAEEYTALIWEVHNEDGVTLYRLAKRLGLTHGALRFRLARYGYKEPQSGGVSKVYTRINPENRVTL